MIDTVSYSAEFHDRPTQLRPRLVGDCGCCVAHGRLAVMSMCSACFVHLSPTYFNLLTFVLNSRTSNDNPHRRLYCIGSLVSIAL